MDLWVGRWFRYLSCEDCGFSLPEDRVGWRTSLFLFLSRLLLTPVGTVIPEIDDIVGDAADVADIVAEYPATLPLPVNQ